MLTRQHDGHESDQERRNYENRMARVTRHLYDEEFNRKVTAWLNERCGELGELAISWCPLQGAIRAYAKQAKDITEDEAQAMGFVADEDFTALDRFGWRMDEAFGVEAWRDVWVWLAEHEGLAVVPVGSAGGMEQTA